MDLMEMLLDDEPDRRALFTPPDPFEELQLLALPLSGLTHTRGVTGLARRYLLVVDALPGPEQEQCRRAMLLALHLHRDDTYKGLPYACHLLRVAVRLARDYGVADGALLCAAVLHDSIEDHGHELLALAGRLGHTAATPADALAHLVGERPAGVVAHLTNPPRVDGADDEDRRRVYEAHVRAEIAASFDVFLVKLSDFTDNAAGLHWSDDAAKTAKVARKYLPLFDAFVDQVGVYQSEGRLTAVQAAQAVATLHTGRNQCARFVAALPGPR